jgi:acyl-CoA thioester hydrolase
MELFEKEEMGPVIFREECIFFREIMFTDKVEVDLQLKKCRRDLSRWTVIHRIYRSDETVCALLTVEGAWLDLKMRKLIKPTADIAEIFLAIPHDVGFEWEQ